ncbi:MAG: radical SAM family heme chaperone HemW [Sedimentisphaerales bacterium]|nr:radical SAM family heme chaperone HemW [Sedimentisphaerales bacterium]
MKRIKKVQAGNTATPFRSGVNSMCRTSQNSSGLYAHIPFCKSKCAYCNFYSEPVSLHDTNRLVQALLKELSQADTRLVRTIYIGGGSPSCLPLSELEELVKAIRSKCPNFVEFTIECNPGQVNPEMLELLYNLGVNRISIGAQSFDDNELKCLGRIHNSKAIETAMYQARQVGFKNISLDLIFAICGSTLQKWQESLDHAIALNPEHISAYSLTIEPETPLGKAIEEGKFSAIDESTDRAMYEQTIDVLTKAGYEHYEISNFAKPGYECQHNIGYWQNRPYIGIGPAAASSTGTCRMQNFSDIKTYVNAIESGQSCVEESILISDIERICETAVLNLRTIYGIDIEEFKQFTGQNPCLLFEEPIRIHCEQGLLNIENNRIFLTAKALPIADYVLCDFASL